MIYNIFITFAAIVLGFLSLYFKERTDIFNKAKEYILKAEDEFSGFHKAGSRKFAFVVDSIYSIIPSPLRFILTKELIGTIVQSVFDSMAGFATRQLDKITKKSYEE